MLQKILEVLTKIIWPWFQRHAWPIIQAKIIDAFLEITQWAYVKTKDVFSSNSRQRESEAEEKAKEAEQKAQHAKNSEDARLYAKEAAIWREIAEQYRRDLEDVKAKLSKLEQETILDAKAEIQSITPEIESDGKGHNPSLKIGGKLHSLPKLNDNAHSETT